MNVPLYVVFIAMIGCGLPLFLFTYTLQAVMFPRRSLRYDAMPASLQRAWILGFAATTVGLLLLLFLQ